jgi:hypothetical protein
VIEKLQSGIKKATSRILVVLMAHLHRLMVVRATDDRRMELHSWHWRPLITVKLPNRGNLIIKMIASAQR